MQKIRYVYLLSQYLNKIWKLDTKFLVKVIELKICYCLYYYISELEQICVLFYN